MKLLLIGGSAFAGLVENLIGRARHTLDCRKRLGKDKINVADYDMLLVDAQSTENDPGLAELMEKVRIEVPELPVIVFNRAQGKEAAALCGTVAKGPCSIVESRDGVRLAHCRLQEMALGQIRSQSVFNRLAEQAITFEYQGAEPGDARMS